LGPPFGSDPAYSGITTTQLTSLTNGLGNYSFIYDSAGAGELAQVTFPFGGHLRWLYSTETYATGGRCGR
jgi:hypothetical protein